jgi:hypothetical protein
VPLWLPLGLGGSAVMGIWSYGRGCMLGHLVGGRTLRELDGQEVRLRFSLVSADLYSYWID